MKRIQAFALVLLGSLTLLSGCLGKKIDPEKTPIPPNTLVLEFASPVKYVIGLEIDGQEIPLYYTRRNKVLWIEGIEPGAHHFNIQSLAYVFGPEFERFKVDEQNGAYFFIQNRRYRSALPKSRSEISIRAYRKKLKKELKEQGLDKRPAKRGEFR